MSRDSRERRAVILAWDWFLGVSLLFATPVFRGDGKLRNWLRRSLAAGGLMCLAGLAGPALGNIDLRLIGEIGYWFVFPATCLMLAIFFKKTELVDAADLEVRSGETRTAAKQGYSLTD